MKHNLSLLLALIMLLSSIIPTALAEEIELVAPPAEEVILPDWIEEEDDIEVVPAPSPEEEAYIEEEIEAVPAPEMEEIFAEEETSSFLIEDGVLTAYTGEGAEVILPENVTVIAAYAFADNSTLVSVTCPESLQAIEDYAFVGCASLERVNYPETCEVSALAFEGCSLLELEVTDEVSEPDNFDEDTSEAEVVETEKASDAEELRSRAPVINTQPVDATVPLGANVTLSVVATGTGLSYQWQYIAPDSSSWSNCTSAAAKAPSWTFAVTKESWSGRQYRCVITDANGNVTKSKRMTLTVGSVVPAAPSDVTLSGKATSLIVKWSPVSGASSYKVYYGTSSSISNATTVTVTTNQATIAGLTYSKTYYVWVKAINSVGSSSASARTSLKLVTPPVITSQPNDVSVRLGQKATLSCRASGTGLTYRWQYTLPGGNTWIECTSAAAYASSWTFTVTKEAWNGRQYRCTITDSIGNVQKTNRMTLTITDAAPVINEQPANVTVVDGGSATVSVTATGTGLTYQWQYRTGTSENWINASSAAAKAASWTFTAKTSMNSRQYRCAVTNFNGITKYSNAMTLTVTATALAITHQPSDVTVVDGKSTTLSVTATGSNLSYQWQYRASASGTWTNASNDAAKAANWTFAAKYSWNGRQYRCAVTNGNGMTVYSNAMTLTVTVAPTIIKVQPQDVTVVEGQKGTISITATGTGLTYKWQYMDPGQTSWTEVNGVTTSSWTTTGNLSKNGRQYRCVITNINGVVTKSNRMTLTVTAADIPVTGIQIDKTSASLHIGDTLTLTATVSPSDATDKSVAWSSSNTTVATVSSAGKVTAKAAGTTTITVKSNADMSKKATCKVTVEESVSPVSDRIDLIQYIGIVGSKMQEDLGLESAVLEGVYYYDADIRQAGGYSHYSSDRIDYFSLQGDSLTRYCANGVYVGMSSSEANEQLSENGWKRTATYDNGSGNCEWRYEKSNLTFTLYFNTSDNKITELAIYSDGRIDLFPMLGKSESYVKSQLNLNSLGDIYGDGSALIERKTGNCESYINGDSKFSDPIDLGYAYKNVSGINSIKLYGADDFSILGLYIGKVGDDDDDLLKHLEEQGYTYLGRSGFTGPGTQKYINEDVLIEVTTSWSSAGRIVDDISLAIVTKRSDSD